MLTDSLTDHAQWARQRLKFDSLTHSPSLTSPLYSLNPLNNVDVPEQRMYNTTTACIY